MSYWHDAADALGKVHLEKDCVSVDQKLKYAEVMALLAIGQELSLIHHAGVNPEYDSRT